MLCIVETPTLFKEFNELYSNSRSLIIPIFSDDQKHPKNNTLCCLYIHLISKNKSFILPFNHSEALNLNDRYLKKLINDKEKFIFDKKSLNYYIDLGNSYDLNLVEYFTNNTFSTYEDQLTIAHNTIYREFYNKSVLNEIVPILKHLEWCNSIRDKIIDKVKSFNIVKPFKEYNTKILNTLSYIESNGLYVNENIFKDKFGASSGKHVIDSMVYTQYNPYTTTGRPSNRFGGTNFAALNKDDGSRLAFKSRFKNGLLVQYDYNAYHLRLIASLLSYKFPDENIHTYFGKIYFGKDKLTKKQYNESKQLSFKLIYGGITKEYRNTPFFSEVNEFIKNLWDIYIQDGYFETPIFKRKMYRKFFKNMNKNKLFNYFLQAFETEMNFEILSDALKRLTNTKSKLVLYTYDSYLLDFCLDDGKDLIDEFKKTIECTGLYPTTVTYGINYSALKEL